MEAACRWYPKVDCAFEMKSLAATLFARPPGFAEPVMVSGDRALHLHWPGFDAVCQTTMLSIDGILGAQNNCNVE